MDSYVLAETFKYLYLLFAEEKDLLLDIDQYLFTTEAHLLPLTLSLTKVGQRRKEGVKEREGVRERGWGRREEKEGERAGERWKEREGIEEGRR